MASGDEHIFAGIFRLRKGDGIGGNHVTATLGEHHCAVGDFTCKLPSWSIIFEQPFCSVGHRHAFEYTSVCGKLICERDDSMIEKMNTITEMCRHHVGDCCWNIERF